MSRVLEIGGGPKPQAHLIPGFEEAEIIYLDVYPEAENLDIIADATFPLPFANGSLDGVFASHILEHITYWREQSTIQEWARVLKEGGSLHILVPSWEWVAREVLSEKPSRGLKPLAFAGQTTPWDVHLNMFTLRQLRALMDRAGLAVTRAITGPLDIMAAGVRVTVEEHYVAGTKWEAYATKEEKI
jgi:SAM-dependent methyltransferase